MPLEAMRYPITLSGMHYLVIHFDIPDVNVSQGRLKVTGLVSNPLSLNLEDIKQPAVILDRIPAETARAIQQRWKGDAGIFHTAGDVTIPSSISPAGQI